MQKHARSLMLTLSLLSAGCGTNQLARSDVLRQSASTAPVEGTAYELHAEPQRSFQGSYDTVRAAVFSPDGKLMAGDDPESAIKIWSLASGEEVSLFGRPDNPVAFSKGGGLILVGDQKRYRVTVRRADGTGTPLIIQHPSMEFFTSAAFSPDGKILVTTTGSIGFGLTPRGQARLWDARTGKLRCEIVTHDGPLYCCAFSPDGKTIALGTGNRLRQFGLDMGGKVRLVDAATGRVTHEWHAHRNAVNILAFSPDGRSLATGGDDKTAAVWDASTAERRASLIGHDDGLHGVAFSPDGKWITTADAFGVKLWNATTFVEQPEFLPRGGAARAFAVFTPDGAALATGNGQGGITLWKLTAR